MAVDFTEEQKECFKDGFNLLVSASAGSGKTTVMIERIVRVAKVGEIYDAKVIRLENYGAFVELFEGTDALVHVSKIAHERVGHPKDVLKIGDVAKVVVTEVDEKGRVNASIKDLLKKPE